MAKAGKHAHPADVPGPPNMHFVRRELETRLRSMRLTPGQRRIAQCIIERGVEVGQMSSTELADLAKVSQPSVTRFATALGYAGFLEMRRQLRAGRDDQAAPEHNLNRYQSAARAEAANLGELVRILADTDKIRAIGTALAGSRPLPVLGLRAASGLARQFCYFGAKVHPDIRLTAEGGSLVEDQLEQAALAGATHLLAFLMPLYPRESVRALHHARSLNLRTIVVSDATYTDDENLADATLLGQIGTTLVYDSYAAGAVLVSVLLDATCEAMAGDAQRRLDLNERSSSRRRVFVG